jgi:hypothetical protein
VSPRSPRPAAMGCARAPRPATARTSGRPPARGSASTAGRPTAATTAPSTPRPASAAAMATSTPARSATATSSRARPASPSRPPSWWSFISQWFEEYAEHESHVSGALSCDAQCRLDTSTCGYCFDGVLNGDELCDDGDFVNGPAPPILQGATCETVAPGVYTGGELFCGFCFGPTAYWTEYCERPPVPPCVAGENCSFELGRTVTPAELAAEGGAGPRQRLLDRRGLVPRRRVDAVPARDQPLDLRRARELGVGLLSELDLVWVRARNQAEPPAALWSQANAYNALPLGEWVHLAGVFDLEQAELRLLRRRRAARYGAARARARSRPASPCCSPSRAGDAFEPWGRHGRGPDLLGGEVLGRLRARAHLHAGQRHPRPLPFR